jgi:16S rRNA (guanine527-N7)-methyltransferase
VIRTDLEKGLSEGGIVIPEDRFAAFELFADELKKWNKKVNLTAICKDADIAVKHIIDSIVFASFVEDGNCVLDIGSGAGVPAIPLKILRTGVGVVSVDAVGKKIMFQRHVARQLAFRNFEALHCRVENLPASHVGRFDVIVSRAFSRLDMLVALASPLLKNGGKIIAMKGPGVHGEVDAVAADTLLSLGFEISSIHAYSLPLNKGDRNLVTITALNAHS